MLGHLCHGTDRRPLEPYGVAAPFLRMAACVSLFVAAASALGAIGVGFAGGPRDAIFVLVNACLTALAVAAVARVAAAQARPSDISLTAWDTEPLS